jgi:hypothetical protein
LTEAWEARCACPLVKIVQPKVLLDLVAYLGESPVSFGFSLGQSSDDLIFRHDPIKDSMPAKKLPIRFAEAAFVSIDPPRKPPSMSPN